jgi:flavin reductase (DIM6/NTAB) family NADH-FMN oxidoreductase RutF
MRAMTLARAFTLIEPGPVVLVTTHDGRTNNVMTISWTMVLDFTPRFAVTTGAWNHSYKALRKTRQCVIAIPTVDMLDTVVGIGTCSGADTDKFARFELTPLPATQVKAPLIKECLANIECRVVEFVTRHDIVVLEAVAAHQAASRRERRTLHAVGDGTFIVDGRRLSRRTQMASKVPAGV